MTKIEALKDLMHSNGGTAAWKYIYDNNVEKELGGENAQTSHTQPIKKVFLLDRITADKMA